MSILFHWPTRATYKAALLVWPSLIVAACAPVAEPPIADKPALTTPRGLAAAEINQLWWITLGLGTVIFIGVMIFMLIALFRRREENAGAPASGNGIVLWGGVIMPTLVLLGVTGFTLNTLMAISASGSPDDLVVEVIGHQWWWEVRYPEQKIVTANELYIPVGRPVQLRITSDDVIHSFWVPELHGKMDMIPGDTNTFWIEADEAGDYWGVCTEFCGIQHARMNFVLVAQPAEEFAAWVAHQQQPAPEPTEPLAQQGQQIFLDSACAYCHAIDGTSATGRQGPDLTHLASRRTLAAGTVENTLGNLGGWIAGPQHIKPGALMPSSDLSGVELQALLAYLSTLE